LSATYVSSICLATDQFSATKNSTRAAVLYTPRKKRERPPCWRKGETRRRITRQITHNTQKTRTDYNRDRERRTTKATMMLKTCASCAVSSHQNHHRNGKSKRRPFPQRSNLLTNNARRLRRPFNTHALVEDENIDNDNRSAENILEKMPKKLEPPQRDTGIPSELDINIDIDEGRYLGYLGFFCFCALSLVLSEEQQHATLSFSL